MQHHNDFNPDEAWKAEWSAQEVTNKHLVKNPMQKIPGFNLPQSSLEPQPVAAQTMADAATCCTNGKLKTLQYATGHPEQTMDHIMTQCPIHRYEGGTTVIHATAPDAVIALNHVNVKLKFLPYISTSHTKTWWCSFSIPSVQGPPDCLAASRF